MKKFLIITQEDYFFIPRNIEKIIKTFGAESIKGIVLIDHTGSINNKKSLFVRGFGIFQSLKYGFLVYKQKILGQISFLGIIPKINTSISSVAKNHGINFIVTSDINTEKFYNKVEELNLDLIISFSAPMVFKKKLLDIPKLGCINLHCSYLPLYAGIFPSFWVLYQGEEYTGCTIHRMDSKIDNGEILKQQKIPIEKEDTIFSLLSKTKSIGGDLMIEAINDVYSRKKLLKPNNVNESSYFSWPTLKELRRFRKNGGKLL